MQRVQTLGHPAPQDPDSAEESTSVGRQDRLCKSLFSHRVPRCRAPGFVLPRTPPADAIHDLRALLCTLVVAVQNVRNNMLHARPSAPGCPSGPAWAISAEAYTLVTVAACSIPGMLQALAVRWRLRLTRTSWQAFAARSGGPPSFGPTPAASVFAVTRSLPSGSPGLQAGLVADSRHRTSCREHLPQKPEISGPAGGT